MIDEEDDGLLPCNSCSASLDESDLYQTVDGDVMCMDCVTICERCEDVHASDSDFYHVDDRMMWCSYCTENYANWCESCNEHTTDDVYYIHDRSESWCSVCADNAYYCDDCNEYYADGCSDCTESRSIHDYSYRPDPVFHSTNKEERLYFGIEVEMEAPRGDYDVVRSASEYASQALEPLDFAYLKSDGSLSCGFELVTHPMSHDYYLNEATELWDTIERLRSVYQMKSWDTRTCGLHIHISRTGFSGGPHMHRFLNLIYSNEELFAKFAGRSSSRWAKFDDVEVLDYKRDADGRRLLDEDGMSVFTKHRTFKDKLLRGRQSDRYSAVNTQNLHTLEMRIFRGTVNSDTIKSQISLAHACVEYTRRLSVRDIANGALAPDKFISYITDNAEMYPHLDARINRLNNLLASV